MVLSFPSMKQPSFGSVTFLQTTWSSTVSLVHTPYTLFLHLLKCSTTTLTCHNKVIGTAYRYSRGLSARPVDMFKGTISVYIAFRTQWVFHLLLQNFTMRFNVLRSKLTNIVIRYGWCWMLLIKEFCALSLPPLQCSYWMPCQLLMSLIIKNLWPVRCHYSSFNTAYFNNSSISTTRFSQCVKV